MSAERNIDVLAREVLGRLDDLGLRIAVAESCTGGEVLAALTAVAGASRTVWGGAVVYTASAKCRLAGLDRRFVRSRGVVSADVTRALAEGIRARAEVDVGIAVTGWAGPETDGPDPVGTVYLGVSTLRHAYARRLELAGDRGTVRSEAVRGLLTMLLEVLHERPVPASEDGS